MGRKIKEGSEILKNINMKREIKFRVWEKGTPNLLGYEHFNTCLNNGFMYVNLSELKEGEDEGDLICHSEFHNPPMLRPKGFNGLFREQFIGLKDKNGVDIYEGDVLKTETDKPMVVGWSEKFASFILNRDGWAFSHWFGESCNPEDCEIIGNIHQNKDLLTD